MKTKLNPKRTRGQALVELALILPILLLALFSFIESARMLQAFLVVQDAAREAARYAVTGLPSVDDCASKGYFDTGYTDQKYVQCRVDNIKAAAREHVLGLAVDPNETDSGRPGYLGILVRGKPCWTCPTELDNPGIPGTRVEVTVFFNMPLAVFRGTLPAIRLTGMTQMVNEGFQVGFGSEAPPTLAPVETLPPLDTDADGLCDQEERDIYGTDPNLADTDGDGLSDGAEVGDTVCDGQPVTPVSDPLDPCSPNPGICTASPEPTEAPPTNTPTATPTSTPLPINILEPLLEGSTYVAGWGEPSQAVRLRDITEPGSPLIGQGVIWTDGTWRVDVAPALTGGHVIYALTNTSSDSATVVQSTPTPFLRPYMDVVAPGPACGPYNTTINFTVTGGHWPTTGDNTVAFSWDGTDSPARQKTGYAYAVPDANGSFTTSFTVNATYVTSETHTLYARMIYSPYYQDSKEYFVPCEGAPTPTPTSTPILPPDLLVQSLDVSPSGVITSTDSVTVTAVILNNSTSQINELFWVDMYVNPDPAPPLVRQPGTEWKALDNLGPNSTVTLTFTYSFAQVGTHNIYVQADSFDYISESNEGNNLAGPVTVDYQGALPTPSPVPPTPTEFGSISGGTWIWLGGQWTVPQERVDVYLYQGATVIATTVSDVDGSYKFDVVAPGTGYTVVGESVVNNKPYSDTRSGIEVINGQETTGINLYLTPIY